MPSHFPAGNPANANRNFLPPGLWPGLVSALAWGVIFISIPPAAQNFPLGDDWAFARGAIWFAQGQGIHYSNWASMPQLGQWLWSWPFLQVIPWQHVALRLSVIVLSWLGLAAFCDLLRLERVPARLAAFAACVLALNPLFFVSQGTYMTDVPALSLGLLALDFYARAMAGKNLRWLLAATVAAMLAVITRQTMLAVPLAAGVLVLRDAETRRRPLWILATLAPVAVCLYTSWWFSQRPDVLPMQPSFDPEQMMFRAFLALHWCGLVVLPLALLGGQQRDWRIFSLCLAAATLATGFFSLCGDELPYGGMFPYCTGMLSLEGTYSDGLVVGQRDLLLTPPVRLAITLLGCVGAAEILTALLDKIRAAKFPGLLLGFTLLQFLILLTLPSMMDRYLEVLFPGAILLIAARGSLAGSGRFAGIATVALSGLISIALSHDWLSWNSARWELGRQAMAVKNIQPSDLEGGFEWNGWYGCPDPAKPLATPGLVAPDNESASLALPFTRHYFPQVTGRFALAFTPPPNSITMATLSYTRWLPPAKKDFLLVQEPP